MYLIVPTRNFKDKNFTRTKLVVEIDRHRNAERKKEKKNKVSIPEAKDTEAKQDLVNKLLDCRRQVFKKNKTLKEDTLKGIEARFEKKGKSTKADRKALLENELFKLSESMRSLERYSKSSTTD